MNGLGIFQIKVYHKYTGNEFDEDLRIVVRRKGTKGGKIRFIMDESNFLQVESGFLERMNTLLANAEVSGLFEGNKHAALMTACKEGSQRDGLMLDSHEELYHWFTQQVAKNLHFVFTMNPLENGLASRAATSPALFNRCVLDCWGLVRSSVLPRPSRHGIYTYSRSRLNIIFSTCYLACCVPRTFHATPPSHSCCQCPGPRSHAVVSAADKAATTTRPPVITWTCTLVFGLPFLLC